MIKRNSYYTIEALDADRVFTCRKSAEQHILEYYQDYIDTSDLEEYFSDIIEEVDYFEDLNKDQQEYLLSSD